MRELRRNSRWQPKATSLRGGRQSAGFPLHCETTLPRYARPVFVRLSNAVDATSTFKLKKAALQEQGFNPDAIDDDLYFRHPDNDEYVPMTKEIYRYLSDQRLRV